MKKTFRILLAVAVASACAACTDDIDNSIPTPNGTGKTVPVEISAAAPAAESAAESTRTIIDINGGTFTTRWENGDRMGVKYAYNNGAAQSGVGEFTYDKASGKFTSALPAYTGAWSYEAAMPYSADSHGSATFGNLRTQKGNAFNSAHDLLVATPVTTTNAAAGKDDNGNELTFTFARQTPILKVRITGGSTSDVIQTVLLTATDGQAISSDKYNATEGLNTAIDATSGISPASNVIAMQFETGTAPTAADAEVYFNIPAGTYNGLQVDVITADGKIAGRKLNTAITASPGKLSLLDLEGLTFKAVAGNKNLEPSLNWPDQDMNAVHDITMELDTNGAPVVDEAGFPTLTYSAAITIKAPTGIAGLKVAIDSEILNDPNSLNLKELDLFTQTSLPGLEMPYGSLGLACTTGVQYKKSIVFDITKLVPMIAMLGAPAGSEHTFSVYVTGLGGTTPTEPQAKLTFRIPFTPTISYNNDADLWTNTATISGTVNPTAKQVQVQYRIKGADTWNTLDVSNIDAATGTFTINIIPTKTEQIRQNSQGTELSSITIDGNTGIFAGHTYEYQLLADNVVVATGTEFTTTAGNQITNGSLETWKDANQFTCKGSMYEGYIYDFWGSGFASSSFTPGICSRDNNIENRTGTYCAKLSAAYNTTMNANIPAPGNLFTGDFTVKLNILNPGGTVSFGKNFAYNARPQAIKFKYHATLYNVEYALYGEKIPVGQLDKARIMACIVDWNSQRQVSAGKYTPTGTWDPEDSNELTEGKIIGYASKMIETSTEGNKLIEVTLPINYYFDTDTAPTGAYTIVISCTTSAYGDYMNASTKNILYVDDFQWVY